MLFGTVWTFLILVACGACAPNAPTEDAPTVVRRAAAEYVFYDVEGGTPAALLASMREGGARMLGGRHFAHTTWTVSWRARWGGTGTCRVSSMDVNLTARVTLPRWVAPAEAPPELRAQWNTFMHALSLHEARHVDVGASAARDVRRAVEAVSGPSCAGMDASTRTAAERVLTAHREQDRQYDRRTRNGATEGAVWPPRPAESRSPQP